MARRTSLGTHVTILHARNTPHPLNRRPPCDADQCAQPWNANSSARINLFVLWSIVTVNTIHLRGFTFRIPCCWICAGMGSCSSTAQRGPQQIMIQSEKGTLQFPHDCEVLCGAAEAFGFRIWNLTFGFLIRRHSLHYVETKRGREKHICVKFLTRQVGNNGGCVSSTTKQR